MYTFKTKMPPIKPQKDIFQDHTVVYWCKIMLLFVLALYKGCGLYPETVSLHGVQVPQQQAMHTDTFISFSWNETTSH